MKGPDYPMPDTTAHQAPAPGSFYAEMIDLCDTHHRAGHAVILKGRIGEGKTSLVDYLSTRDTVEGTPVGGAVHLRLGGKAAEAVNGIPTKGETTVAGKTYSTSRETIPDWALELEEKSAGGTRIVYLYARELNLAFQDTSAAFQDVMLDHALPNGYVLPDTTRIICDMNPRAEVSGTFDLSGALTNRVGIYDFEVPLYDWTEGLVGGFPGEAVPEQWEMHYRSVVAGFLSAYPQHVYEIPTAVDRSENPWASKRSWTTLAHVLASAAERAGAAPGTDTASHLANATVGPRVGGPFAAWLAGFTIPTVAEMVADPACLDTLDTAGVHAAANSLVTQAVAASSGADGVPVPATAASSPVSMAVGVLNHLRSMQPDIAAMAVLRLIRDAGQAVHGPALLNPDLSAEGFVAPENSVDPGFAAISSRMSSLTAGL